MSAPSPTNVGALSDRHPSGWGDIDPQLDSQHANPNQDSPAGGHLVLAPPPALIATRPNATSRVEEWDVLTAPITCLAENLSDVEATRIATANRLSALQREGSEGPELGTLRALVSGLEALEHQAELALRRAIRLHPLGPWMKRSKGVGEKQGARLVAAIGNPYWNSAADRARRGPAELWAYCGYHVLPADQTTTDTPRGHVGGHPLHPSDQLTSDDHARCVAGVAARRRKGQRSNWNATAKMRARLIAESCVKARGPYGDTYQKARAHYANDPIPLIHQHNRALRIVAKEILKDMWVEARDWHLA